MGDERITVFLADDHQVLREGLTLLLDRDPLISIVGQCGDGLKVVQQVRNVKPDVLILDVTLPGLNGLAVCEEVSRKVPGTSVIILTMHRGDDFVVGALESGASGYLLKDADSGQIIEAIHAVRRGEAYLGAGISRGVLTRLNTTDGDPYKRLTAREKQVLQLVAEGKTNRQIAQVLSITHKTVDTHRNHLMQKLDLHNQTELVKYALRKGLIVLQ